MIFAFLLRVYFLNDDMKKISDHKIFFKIFLSLVFSHVCAKHQVYRENMACKQIIRFLVKCDINAITEDSVVINFWVAYV